MPAINLIINPTLTPDPVSYAGVEVGHGAKVENGEVVFDGAGTLPFARFMVGEPLVEGHTYGVKVSVSSLTGNLRVMTIAASPVLLGTITAASEAPAAFTFEAAGDEAGFQVMGDLHGCVARFRAPMLSE